MQSREVPSSSAHTAPLVSIVIVTYNGGSFVSRCLDSVRKCRYRPIEVIVVDNASMDETADILLEISERWHEVKVIKNDTNQGYGGGNNVGIMSARGKYVILLNDDTVVQENWIEPIVTAFEGDDSISAIQPRILLLNEPELHDEIGSSPTWTGFLRHIGVRAPAVEQGLAVREIFSGKGAALALRRSTLDEIGLLDESYFAYFEENDLCWRIWLVGSRVLYTPASTVYHEGAGTWSRNPKWNLVRLELAFRNRLRMLLSNLGMPLLFFVLVNHFFLTGLISLSLVLGGHSDLNRAVLRGVFGTVKALSETFRKRRRIQRLRKVPDRVLARKHFDTFPLRLGGRGLSQYVRDPATGDPDTSG